MTSVAHSTPFIPALPHLSHPFQGSCVDCQALNTSVCPPNSVKLVSIPQPSPQGSLNPNHWILLQVTVGSVGVGGQARPGGLGSTEALKVGVLEPGMAQDLPLD